MGLSQPPVVVSLMPGGGVILITQFLLFLYLSASYVIFPGFPHWGKLSRPPKTPGEGGADDMGDRNFQVNGILLLRAVQRGINRRPP